MIFNQQPPSAGGGSSAATHSVTCQENSLATYYVWDDDTSNWSLTTDARTGDYVLVKRSIKNPFVGGAPDGSQPNVYDSNGNEIIGNEDFVILGADVTHARVGDKYDAFYEAYRMPDEDVFVKNTGI